MANSVELLAENSSLFCSASRPKARFFRHGPLRSSRRPWWSRGGKSRDETGAMPDGPCVSIAVPCQVAKFARDHLPEESSDELALMTHSSLISSSIHQSRGCQSSLRWLRTGQELQKLAGSPLDEALRGAIRITQLELSSLANPKCVTYSPPKSSTRALAFLARPT